MATTQYEGIPAVAGEAAGPSGTVVMVAAPRWRTPRGSRRSRSAWSRRARPETASSPSCRRWGTRPRTSCCASRTRSPTPAPREVDMLISVGERVSCALAAMAIHDLGHEAISLTGSQAGIVTDLVHGRAKIVDIRARRIHEALDADRIVLVAGFQGVSTAYDVTTLGRGGSNLTAVALAAALGADACEIARTRRGSSRPTRGVPTARKLRSATRRCWRWRRRARRCSSYARSSWRAATESSSTFARASATRTAPGSGGVVDAREGDHLRRHAHARRVGLPRGGVVSPRGCSRRFRRQR